jgi:hypothetical protein
MTAKTTVDQGPASAGEAAKAGKRIGEPIRFNMKPISGKQGIN